MKRNCAYEVVDGGRQYLVDDVQTTLTFSELSRKSKDGEVMIFPECPQGISEFFTYS